MGNNDKNLDQIAENMRFYTDMRFKQLTLLLAWLTIVAGGVAQYGEKILVGNLRATNSCSGCIAIYFCDMDHGGEIFVKLACTSEC